METEKNETDSREESNLDNSPISGPEKEEESLKVKAKREAKSIALILIAVMTFRSVLFEPFRIPSGSMIPTLMIGDFILVNKFSYGFKVPFSDINLFGFDSNPVYIFGESDPQRGEVIVFKYPRDKSLNFIKRVVGLPGDTIEVRDKVVYVNNEAIEMEQFPGVKIMEDMDDKYKNRDLSFYNVETGEADHVVQLDKDNFYTRDFPQVTVPLGMFFVMGDNRDSSSDSREWGFVPRNHIKGKAILVWFSLILPGSEHPMKFRPWRIGTLIK